jgi:hypothetical protein
MGLKPICASNNAANKPPGPKPMTTGLARGDPAALATG